jgi:replicative DNA helicase
MDESQKSQYKSKLGDHLTAKGIDTHKLFRCLHPSHNDGGRPNMGFKDDRVRCFNCGNGGDIFDVIGWEYGLTNPKDQFVKVDELFGGGAWKPRENQNQTRTLPIVEPATPKEDLTAYFADVQKHLRETDYLLTRGISYETAARFRIGYDADYRKDTNYRDTGGNPWKAIIIPTGEGSYTARNTDPNASKDNRIRKQGRSSVYQADLLKRATKPIFVVEGELDALSIYEVGGDAVGLGSTANASQFLGRVEKDPPNQPLILSLDNDEAGQKCTEELVAGLRRLNLNYSIANASGKYNDPSEALQENREAFKRVVEDIYKMTQQNVLDEYKKTVEEYRRTESASSYLDLFLNGIKDSVNTPSIPTGFKVFDEKLGGGLHEGLYVIGAVASLGKTTFVTQIADVIADHRNDVLIFSLEMARKELIAKSISRNTFILDAKAAKTVWGITQAARYSDYSDIDKANIKTAISEYRRLAQNIYIVEGMGDIGVEQVRKTVKRHIDLTGNKPVVIIDYLQILAPYNVRSTDKQNIDKAVLELKRISRDFKLPVIAISSLNRASYFNAEKSDEGIGMAAFKESGAIEYSCDVLIGLQCQNKDDNPRKVELVILKNRNGELALKDRAVKYDYYPAFNYFDETGTYHG